MAMTSSPYDIPALDGSIQTGSKGKQKPKPKLKTAPAPDPAKDPARAARAVQDMNAAQLAASQDFLFRLAGFDRDTGIIDGLTKSHPQAMTAAGKLTASVLGTPADWHEAAMARWQDSDWSSESFTVGRLAPALWNAAAALAPVTAAGLSLLAGAHPSVTLSAALAAVLSVLFFLPRPVNVGVPVLHPGDVEQMHKFVQEAVFADLLEGDGAITPEQAAALRRGRDHLLFITNTTHAMSMRPFDPATLDTAAVKQAA